MCKRSDTDAIVVCSWTQTDPVQKAIAAAEFFYIAGFVLTHSADSIMHVCEHSHAQGKVCVRVCVCLCVFMHIRTYMYTTCTYMYIYVCMYVCIYIYACMCVCVFTEYRGRRRVSQDTEPQDLNMLTTHRLCAKLN